MTYEQEQAAINLRLVERGIVDLRERVATVDLAELQAVTAAAGSAHAKALVDERVAWDRINEAKAAHRAVARSRGLAGEALIRATCAVRDAKQAIALLAKMERCAVELRAKLAGEPAP